MGAEHYRILFSRDFRLPLSEAWPRLKNWDELQSRSGFLLAPRTSQERGELAQMRLPFSRISILAPTRNS